MTQPKIGTDAADAAATAGAPNERASAYRLELGGGAFLIVGTSLAKAIGLPESAAIPYLSVAPDPVAKE